MSLKVKANDAAGVRIIEFGYRFQMRIIQAHGFINIIIDTKSIDMCYI